MMRQPAYQAELKEFRLSQAHKRGDVPESEYPRTCPNCNNWQLEDEKPRTALGCRPPRFFICIQGGEPVFPLDCVMPTNFTAALQRRPIQTKGGKSCTSQ